MDEPFTLFWSQHSVHEILELAKNENNPPLHFLIVHFWMKLFGIGPISVRFPSLIFSSLAAAVIFGIGRRHFGWLAGIGASLLFTLSTEQIYYSHEARTYALLSLLVALAIHCFLRVVEEPRKKRNYFLLGIWCTLLIYSHFLGFWVLVMLPFCIILIPERKVLIPRFLLLYLGIILAYAPNLFVMLARLRSVAAAPTWVPKPHWTQLYGHLNIFWNGSLATIAFLLVLVGGLVMQFPFAKQRKPAFPESRQTKKVLVLALIFSGIYLGIYFQSLVFTPAFIPRYLSWVSIPFFLLVAGGLSSLFTDLRWQAIAFGLILLAMIPGFRLNPSNDSAVVPMVQYVQDRTQPGTMLIIAPDYFDKTYVYHADSRAFQDHAHWKENLAARRIFPVNGYNSLPQATLDSTKYVILVDDDIQFVYPENGILEGLKGRFQLVESQHFEKSMDVYLFEKR